MAFSVLYKYMSWTKERKTFVTFIFGVCVVGIAALFTVPLLIEYPTCTDTKRNGNETGIDCGGSCSKICKNPESTIRIAWERSVRTSESTYDAVAYIENNDNESAPRRVKYKATFFDASGSIIDTRDGESLIRAGAGTALYVPSIVTEKRIIAQTRFELTEVSSLERVTNQNTVKAVQVIEEPFDNLTGTPRLTIKVENDLFDDVNNIDVVALLYDTEDTLIAVGKTFIEKIPARGTAPAYFTWQTPFSRPARTEIQLLISPFK